MKFEEALALIKNNDSAYMRLPQWKPDVKTRFFHPREDGLSDMTIGYTYVESRFGRSPWRQTVPEEQNENWEVYDAIVHPFRDVYSAIRQGHRIARKDWKGWWFWDNELNTIIIHLEDGTEFDIRDTKDLDFTMSNIMSNDWLILP